MARSAGEKWATVLPTLIDRSQPENAAKFCGGFVENQ
jgi:hypothetical protein